MSQAEEGQRVEEILAQQAKSPHERAMDRHEAAVDALHQAEQRAAEMVRAAEREVGESLGELMRYEKQPGVPLPVAEQRRREDAHVMMRRRMEEHLGGQHPCGHTGPHKCGSGQQ